MKSRIFIAALPQMRTELNNCTDTEDYRELFHTMNSMVLEAFKEDKPGLADTVHALQQYLDLAENMFHHMAEDYYTILAK